MSMMFLQSGSRSCAYGRGGKISEQFLNFKQNFIRPRSPQGEFEQPLWRKLRAALGVARDKLHKVGRIDGRILHEPDLELTSFAIHLRDADPLALEAQHGGFKQINCGIGRRTIAVFHLRANFVDCRFGGRTGDFFVEAQALILFRHVAFVDAQCDAEVELRGRAFFAAFALHLLDRGLKHGCVELKPDSLNVAALLAAEHVAGSAQFQVEGRDFESRTQITELLQSGEASARDFGELVLGWNQKIRIGAPVGTAHTAAQLIKLAEAVPLGAVDQDGIRQRDVEAVFDDRGGNQHVEFVAHEGQHHLLKLAFAHLAVGNGDTRTGNKLLNARRDFVDRLDAVVHEEHLATAFQLHFDRRAHDFFVESRNYGLNRHAILGRRLDDAHVAQADERHVQRARNGRGAHGEHVNLLPQLLEPFLVANAEALLFVDDEQAEILKLDVLREQAMRADQDIDLAGFHLLEDQLLLLCGAEAGDHLDVDRELAEAVFEGLEVLEAEDRG